MKKVFLSVVLSFTLLVSLWATAFAGEFRWFDDFNIQAQGNPDGFRVRMASRFKIGNAEITAVIDNADSPADAYMVFRLGEMTGKPVDEVMKDYTSQKGNGWGVIAKSLGIKPGSQEFKALKNSHDLHFDDVPPVNFGKEKGNGKKGKKK